MFAQFVAASCSRGDFGWVYVEADVFCLRPQLQPTAQGGKLSYFTCRDSSEWETLTIIPIRSNWVKMYDALYAHSATRTE